GGSVEDSGEGPAAPGTRLALGTRLGRPATVVPAVTGAKATSAACHPASAGEVREMGSGLAARAPFPWPAVAGLPGAGGWSAPARLGAGAGAGPAPPAAGAAAGLAPGRPAPEPTDC